MPDYAEQNAKIGRIMGWTPPDLKQGYVEWKRPDGSFSGLREEPDWCGDNHFAAEFRQYTMRQEWCKNIESGFHKRVEVGYWCAVIGWVKERSIGVALKMKTEAAASSLACLSAWQTMEQTADVTATAN